MPASFGLRHINNLPVSWGRSPTCPGIFSHLLSLGDPGWDKLQLGVPGYGAYSKG